MSIFVSLIDAAPPDHMNPLALMAAISKAQRDGKSSGQGGSGPQTSREMSVKTDLWLSGGLSSKMDEIQRMSGAQVHVTGVTQLAPTIFPSH